MDGQAIHPVPAESQLHGGSAQQQGGGGDDSNRKKANVRKRTKTGCLTCRKRRIKCDETRPICNNCIKSKRQCEGYNQRVIFKEPIGSFQTPYHPAVYPTGRPNLVDESLAAQQGKANSRGPLQPIAPRPPSSFDYRQHHALSQNQNLSLQTSLHQTQIPVNGPPYGFDGQFAAEGYPQMPNPLLSPDSVSISAQVQSSSGLQSLSPEGIVVVERSSDLQQPGNRIVYHQQPNRLLEPVEGDWAYEGPDDDNSLVDSDDDFQDGRSLLLPVTNMLSRLWSRNATDVRTFSTFAQSDALLAYMDSPHSTEFTQNGLGTLFMHFINITGPSVSMYERHQFDPSDHEQFGFNARAGHSLWSYTFPVLSLRHPGLLHAMLALASLQLAKLQDIPATAAMKHYHRSIRRIAKNVRSPLRRAHPATLAATLLLGYFEVWSSDHTKWCNHLFGARILLREIPLRDMTKVCLPVKRMRQQQGDDSHRSQMNYYFPGHDAPSHMDSNSLNYQLLSTISGAVISPEDYGDGEDQLLDERCFSTTDTDIEKYDTLCDLFWWYCKMDVYQSILGGTKLFMEYQCWTQCPPRAPISKFNAIFGTYDHLMLLLGRLSNYAAKDLSRKRKSFRGQGGPPGGGSPPMFPGMLPTQGTFHVPMGFSPPRDTTPQSDSYEDLDPNASFEAATLEWSRIHLAFETFESQLGPDFQPLSTEYADDKDSPFGPVVQYKTHSIAGIWMNYYMGLIHLHRSHPTMPPAAMRAAGMTAHKTGAYAIQIGRIAAGLSVDCSQFTELNTFLGAAFIESSFCLFVAGVQYQDASQRHWLIQRMYDIARLTGWQSARQIAEGCESAWTKAAQMAGAPPYMRPSSIVNAPMSVWENPRRIDRRIHELDQSEDKRLVLAKAERAHYALGLLGVEDDLAVLDLQDDH